jgi:two-component system sensor histidine kinase VanS
MKRLFERALNKLRSRQTSIVWKLFFVTAAMFAAFIAAWLIFQSLFFGKLYSAAKEKQSLGKLRDFCGRYAAGSWDRTTLDGEIAAMADLFDIQAIILNEYGNDRYGGIEMVMTDADGREISVDLHDVRFIEGLKEAGLAAGSRIRIEGIFIRDGLVLYPYKISFGGTEWTRSRNDENAGAHPALSGAVYPESDNVVQLEGEVEYLRAMSESEYSGSDSPYLVLKAALKQWQTENIRLPAKQTVQEYKDTATGIRYKILILPFTTQNGDKEAVFSIVPIQPLDEAVRLTRDYLWYVFTAALIFVSLLSFMFYKMVSKPLVKINEAALKMSHMDFSVSCDIHTHDELGSLSKSLNIMSSRLHSTITELKEFVSNASHELKTPIAVMGGYVEALRDDIRSDKRDRYLERLQQEVERMNSLVQDMLELSRMESNTGMLNIEAVDLYKLTKTVLDEYSRLLNERHIQLRVNIAKESSQASGDQARLEQVIRNFVSNALRHTPDNGTIWIGTEQCGDNVTFMIENEGMHIPEDKIEKIWDRFYRVEASRNGGNNGTGLGLAICAKILQLHQAAYGAVNTEKGVRFFFVLKKINS